MNIFTGSDVLLVVAAVGASVASVVGALVPFWVGKKHRGASAAQAAAVLVYRMADGDREVVEEVRDGLHSIKGQMIVLIDEVIELRRVTRDKG